MSQLEANTFAISNISNVNSEVEISFLFDPAAPAVFLPEGVFGPFNSRSTLFRHRALWVLPLPTRTSSSSTAATRRSYWAQRLLWEIGGTLGFISSDVGHVKHVHTQDVSENNNNTSDDMIQYLTNWACPRDFSFFLCVEKLSRDLAKNRFWGSDDVELTRLYINDLKHMGYPEPQRVYVTNMRNGLTPEAEVHDGASPRVGLQDVPFKSDTSLRDKREVRLCRGSVVNFVAVEQSLPNALSQPVADTLDYQSRFGHAKSFCSKVRDFTLSADDSPRVDSNRSTILHDVLLIVIFNWPGWYAQTLPYLEVMHRHVFPNIVYCGSNATSFMDVSNEFRSSVSFIEAPVNGGRVGYICTALAMDMSYNVSGYLQVAEDTLLNSWNLQTLDKYKIWLTEITLTFNCSVDNFEHHGVRGLWNREKGKVRELKRHRSISSKLFELLQKCEISSKKFNFNIDHFFKMIGENIGMADNSCIKAMSDVLYVPGHLTNQVKFYLYGLAKIFSGRTALYPPS